MFNSNDSCLTMPVMPAYANGGGYGFGGEGSWFIWLIVILAIFGGWGNGFGYGGYGAGGVQENYILTSDFSQLSKQISDTYNMTDRKFEGIANGICSLGYDQQAQMNNLGTNIMQGTNTLQGAIKDCCCQTQQNIADVKYTIGATGADINYNLATQANMLDRTVSDKFCQTNFNNATNTRDIIDSQSASTRAILDKLCQMESNAKDEKIADLQAKNFDLRLSASQAAQNSLLISELGPKYPIPSYTVPNPYCNCQCGQNFGTTIA